MNIYDIIIEKTTKEWNSFMISNVSNDKWEIPKYSKKQIERAGKTIISVSQGVPIEEYKNALEILNNWRSSHAYPLQVIASNLRRNNPNAIVVQRLKRLDSITGKLERFPEMSLYRMQDLGGCRVIVDNIDQVYESLNRYKNSRIRHILKREDDYIKSPKKSGYRSYHVVYKFHSEDKEVYNKNMQIEIQFRTKLQHMWATAVEMMGVYTKSQLKASIGDENVLRFFVLVSSVFAKMENAEICPNTVNNQKLLISEIKQINNRLNLLPRLGALSVAINHVSKNRKYNRGGYFLLILNYAKNTLQIRDFSSGEIGLATTIYNRIEGNKDKNIDVVLVSAMSFDTLKSAYPNYFADISDFVKIMSKILAK